MELSPRTKHIGIGFSDEPTHMGAHALREIALGFAYATHSSTRLPPKYNMWVLAEHRMHHLYLEDRHFKIVGNSIDALGRAIGALESDNSLPSEFDFGNPNVLLVLGSRKFLGAAVHLFATSARGRADNLGLHLMRIAYSIHKGEIVWVRRDSHEFRADTIHALTRRAREDE